MSLNAWWAGPLRVLVPKGFETPFEVIVARRNEFICRAELCSHMKQQGASFVYAGDGKTDARQFVLRSDQTLMIDNGN